MEVKVRKYEEADLEDMLEIWNEVVAAALAFPQDQPLGTASGKEFFAQQSYCGVAVDKQGKVTGLYILHPNNIGRCGHIANASYAVAGNARGCGIGETLVKDSLAMAKKLGFGIMQFNAVTASNKTAQRLYDKLGFQKLGTVPGGFRHNNGEYEDINLYFYKL